MNERFDTIESASGTDTGCVRTNNEDALWTAPREGLFAIADGMGGAAAGEVASEMAINALKKITEKLK